MFIFSLKLYISGVLKEALQESIAFRGLKKKQISKKI